MNSNTSDIFQDFLVAKRNNYVYYNPDELNNMNKEDTNNNISSHYFRSMRRTAIVIAIFTILIMLEKYINIYSLKDLRLKKIGCCLPKLNCRFKLRKGRWEDYCCDDCRKNGVYCKRCPKYNQDIKIGDYTNTQTVGDNTFSSNDQTTVEGSTYDSNDQTTVEGSTFRGGDQTNTNDQNVTVNYYGPTPAAYVIESFTPAEGKYTEKTLVSLIGTFPPHSQLLKITINGVEVGSDNNLYYTTALITFNLPRGKLTYTSGTDVTNQAPDSDYSSYGGGEGPIIIEYFELDTIQHISLATNFTYQTEFTLTQLDGPNYDYKNGLSTDQKNALYLPINLPENTYVFDALRNLTDTTNDDSRVYIGGYRDNTNPATLQQWKTLNTFGGIYDKYKEIDTIYQDQVSFPASSGSLNGVLLPFYIYGETGTQPSGSNEGAEGAADYETIMAIVSNSGLDKPAEDARYCWFSFTETDAYGGENTYYLTKNS